MERRNAWKDYDKKETKELEKLCKDYRKFLDNGKTERECVKYIVHLAEKAGYQDLENVIQSGKKIKSGDKLYAVNMKKAIALFQIGTAPLEEGLNILGAHIDSPRMDVKQNPLYEDTDLAYLDTHYYGGIKKYQWVTLPLAIHGVVAKKNGEVVDIVIGEEETDPIFCVTDLLIHLAGEQMDKKAAKVVEGEQLDILVGSRPLAKEEKEPVVYSRSAHAVEKWIGTEEVDEILNRTLYANRKKEFIPHKGIRSRRVITAPEPREVEYRPSTDKREEYLLVDGYNVIHAWKDLRELSQRNMDSARDKLMDILCNYQGMKKCEVIVVFDAYKVTEHATDYFDYHNIHVVYTKEAETADQFIEKFAHSNKGKYKIRVVTSDGLEQIIIRGQGCLLVSSREFEEEVKEAEQNLREDYLEKQKGNDCFHHVNVLKYTGL